MASDTDSDYSSEEEDDIDIHGYCLHGTAQQVEWALSKDRTKLIDLKRKEDARAPLHVTADAGLMNMSVLLIKRGALVDARDSLGRTPLHLAAAKGLTELCRMLLECGANIKTQDSACWTSLHHAACGGHIDCCVMLVKRGVDLGAEEAKYGKTALHFCAERGLAELADILIIRGAPVYGSGDSIYSKTPLHLAAMVGHKETTSILVRRGADLEAMSGFLDMTPLHLACERGNLDCVQVLVEAGADMGAFGFNINGSTPLHLAAQYGHDEVCTYLVSKGASLLTQGRWTVEGTALHIAVQYGNMSAMYTLLELGSDIGQKDSNGLTAMHTACKYKNWDLAFALIDKGASLVAEANNGRFPLEFIPQHESYMKEKLRLAGVNYDAEMDRLAELAAKKIRDEEAAAKLRQEQAEEEARQAAFALALRQKREARFAALLFAACNISGELSALTDLSIEFSDLDINLELDGVLGSKAITRAAFNGFNVIVAALLKWEGIDINVQEKDGNTALHMAASRGKAQHRSIVEMLLLHNARIGIPNNAGKTAASVAATTYLAEIIRNPRFIQTRTQMEVLSMSSHMNNTRDMRAKAMGPAMATATGGSANLLSLTRSTKIGVGMSMTNAPQNNIYNPAMDDPATLLLADAYGQNYSPVKALVSTWKHESDTGSNSGKFNDTYVGDHAFSATGEARNMNTNTSMINAKKFGKDEFHYADPNQPTFHGMPEVNEYGNIYMPPKLTSSQELAYQQSLRGPPGSGTGFSTETGTGTSAAFDPANMTDTRYPAGFGDFHRKTTTQYQLREQDPGFQNSYTHFAETHKITLPMQESNDKKPVKVDQDTENFARGKFGPVPHSFRGCTDDLFFLEFNKEEAETENKIEDDGSELSKQIISERLRMTLDAQGADYEGEDIDALVFGKAAPALSIKDQSRRAQIDHVKFELAKLRNKIAKKIIPAQAAHTPTTFDTTEEWMNVRDYLWLLGQPYSRANPIQDKRVLLKSLGKTMDEMHRIFCDPDSLLQRWQDPLAIAINNINNYDKSEKGKVRGSNHLGETRRMFLQASSDQLMKEWGEEGLKGKGLCVVEGKSLSQSGNSNSLPPLNNSNMVGGNAFQWPGGASSPVPPTEGNVNQFVFSNQRNPSPAKGAIDAVESTPSSLAEAADLRLTQLCQKFVSDALDIFAPAGGWPQPRVASNTSNTSKTSTSALALMSDRLKSLLHRGSLNEELASTLRKLLENAARDVVVARSKGGKGPISVEGNQALVFPPRQRRVLIDSMYEVAAAFMKRAEEDFPLDSIRAHLWAHNGRKQFKRYQEKHEQETDMTLWLRDMHLEGTIIAFKQLGFKELSDFCDLSLADVQEYFPFLRLGDSIRVARSIKLFTPELLQGYTMRVHKGEVNVSLPPIPNLQPTTAKTLNANAIGKTGPTPSRRVKAPKSEPRAEKAKKSVTLDREPTREEYLGGVKISDYYLKKLQEQISEETDGINLRLASDLEHGQSIIRKKGLIKQVVAKQVEGQGVVVSRAAHLDGAIADLQAAITKATKGFQFRLKSDLTVANELVRESGLLGMVICREVPAVKGKSEGGIEVIKVSDIGAAIDILQEQITKATKGFQVRLASDLDAATKMIQEAGMHGIVVARENGRGEIIMERLIDESHGSQWELYVNTIAIHDALNLGTSMDKQDPSVKIWLGDNLIGKTVRVKDAGGSAEFKDSFHMHISEKFYNQKDDEPNVSIVVEVFNEGALGGLVHLGKGSIDLLEAVPKDSFNDYVEVSIPLHYELAGMEEAHSKTAAVETITDLEFSQFQMQVSKETVGVNMRIASDFSHAGSMIKKKGWQHLVIATENAGGDILVKRLDQQLGHVKLKMMVQN